MINYVAWVACKIDKYLDIKNCSCEKRLIDKLVSLCEDGILNTTETSLNDKKVTHEKYNYLIHCILLVIICSLLNVISILLLLMHKTLDN